MLIPLSGLALWIFQWCKLQKKKRLIRALEEELRCSVGAKNCRELQFIEMAKLAAIDSQVKFIEQAGLKRWVRVQQWDQHKIALFIERGRAY